jgi:hypothetical protein
VVCPGRLDRGLGALAEVGERADEHQHGIGDGLHFADGAGPVGQIQPDALGLADHCQILAGPQLELAREIHRHSFPEP